MFGVCAILFRLIAIASIWQMVYGACKIEPDANGHVDIPGGWLNIAEDAFNECASLKSVIIADSVLAIGQKAFYYCQQLKNVTIGASVQSIGNSAFLGTSLGSLVIPDSVKLIQSLSFSQIKSLETVSIPNSVESIALDAFRGCDKLNKCSLDKEGVDEHGHYVVPSSWSSVPEFHFYSCPFLKSVTLPSSIESIGYMSFSQCHSL